MICRTPCVGGVRPAPSPSVVAFGGAVLFFVLADIIVYAMPIFVLDMRISVVYLCGKKEEPDE